jgi:hypothetical protein
MAIIFRGRSRCSLCDRVIAESDDIVLTSHFIGDPADTLWRFSDSGMHRSCFLAWDQRAEFVRRYNETLGSRVWGNGTRHRMTPEGELVTEQVAAPRDEPW